MLAFFVFALCCIPSLRHKTVPVLEGRIRTPSKRGVFAFCFIPSLRYKTVLKGHTRAPLKIKTLRFI